MFKIVKLTEQKDLSNIQKISEEFGKNVTDQITSSNKEVMSAITAASEQSTQVVNELVAQAKQTMSKAAK